MIGTLSAAWAVCHYSRWSVSNLSVNKMLYIAHGTYMAEKGDWEKHPLIDEYFHAWDYGPVIPDLYRKFKFFGSDAIKPYVFLNKSPDALPDEGEEEVRHIKKAVGWLEGKRASQLIAMTHVKDGAWEKNYRSRQSNTISDEDIFNEYEKYRQRG